MRRIALPAALACALALTGCVATPDSTPEPAQTRTPIPTTSPTAEPAEKLLDTAATKDISVAAYTVGGYITVADSGFTRDGGTSDAFPAGTWVAVFRLNLTGHVLFGEADVTGLSYTSSSWDDGEQPVFDDKAGAHQAEALGIPYGAAAALDTTPWVLQNNTPVTYAIAVYVPAGASTLTLTVDIPSQRVPLKLRLPVGGE